MKKLSVLTLLFLSLGIASCNNDDDNTTASMDGELTLNLTGLEDLGNDYVYEGWLIVNGTPVSTGTFSSVNFPQQFNVSRSDLDNASKFVLSIEPKNDSDPAPAATKLLAGDFSGNSATVSSEPFLGMAEDYMGSFLMATPTDGTNNNEKSGLWFTDLDLPTLPSGWKYEGWVVFDGKPVSTGTFIDEKMADDNASTSPYKGNVNNGPNKPGEDFIMGSFNGVNFPTELDGRTVVLSVEPYPDNSENPFAVKPLAVTIPVGTADHTNINLEAGPLTEISGTVRRN